MKNLADSIEIIKMGHITENIVGSRIILTITLLSFYGMIFIDTNFIIPFFIGLVELIIVYGFVSSD